MRNENLMPFNLDTALETLERDPDAPLDLAEIALWLAKDEYPFLDAEAHLNEIAGMAHEVASYVRSGHLAHRVQGLCRYLFHEMGFRGNQRDYYEPRNSYLNQVLERKLGIPISLSSVTMAVGTRAGLTMHGVGLPGHFIVRAFDGDQEVLVDPFHGGRILTRDDCEILVQQRTGVPFEASSLALTPLPLGATVQRMLVNLKSIYIRNEDWPRACRVMQRLRQINRHDVVLRRDLGRCYLQQEQPGKAIDHLQAYVNQAGDAADHAAVERLLRMASNMVAQWN